MTQVVKSGDRRSCHASALEKQQRHMGLCVEAHEGPAAGDFCTNKELRLRQSWWSVHALEKGLPEILAGKIFLRRVVPTMAVDLERLCDDCNTTRVRHSLWMDRWN